MDFKTLQAANKEIKTTPIKGKNYAEVNERIKAFRMLYPDGAIETEIISIENGVCIMKAIVKDESGTIIGNGTAYEKENEGFINKTSYIENCETSAVGRALGMCGIGIDTSVASFEEVQNAIEQQENEKKEEIAKKEQAKKESQAKTPTLVTKPMINTIENELERTNIEAGVILDTYEVKLFDEMTVDQYKNFMNRMKKTPTYEG